MKKLLTILCFLILINNQNGEKNPRTYYSNKKR